MFFHFSLHYAGQPRLMNLPHIILYHFYLQFSYTGKVWILSALGKGEAYLFIHFNHHWNNNKKGCSQIFIFHQALCLSYKSILNAWKKEESFLLTLSLNCTTWAFLRQGIYSRSSLK